MLYSPGIAERNVTGYCSRPIEGVYSNPVFVAGSAAKK